MLEKPLRFGRLQARPRACSQLAAGTGLHLLACDPTHQWEQLVGGKYIKILTTTSQLCLLMRYSDDTMNETIQKTLQFQKKNITHMLG